MDWQADKDLLEKIRKKARKLTELAEQETILPKEEHVAEQVMIPPEEHVGPVYTGISGFDHRVGGMIPGLTMMIGEPEANCRLLITQLTCKVLKDGLPVVYVITDRPTTDLVEELHRFGCPTDEMEMKGLLNLLDTYSTRQSLQSALPRFAKNSRVLIVDTLSSLILSTGQFEEIQKLLVDMREWSRLNNGVCILSVVRGLHDQRTETLLKHFCDVVIDFYAKETGRGKMQRYFRILKKSNQPATLEAIPFNVTQEGIVVEEYSRV